ncbi:uncharacterized protein K02A2.6-like [Leptopilina heterotoma]|uniref:uncharacterized protein K02A2.6-like n=1 Tax=Leptopilina heterotoma TaxID=63436 RepID=UPI001CAA2F0A|nr:uncharacterized protein K02A2.6-like [Leptopilina heterotoma]
MTSKQSADELVQWESRLRDAAHKCELKTTELDKRHNELLAQREHLSRESQRLNELRAGIEADRRNMASIVGSINEYSRKENWTLWFERLGQFFIANSVQENKKASLFLTLLGGEGYAILRNLCAPDLPSSKTFTELATIMKDHMEPTPNEILERYKFRQCVQRETQEVKAFVEEIKKASTYCNFGANLQDSMRDQFVWGLRTEALQKRLLREKDLTFVKAVELSTAFELASKGAAGMNESTKKTEQPSVNVIRDKNRFKSGSSGSSEKQTDKTFQCMRCGKSNHSPANCKYKSYKCNSCGKVGHLAGMCKTKGFNSSQEKTNNVKFKKQNFNKQNFLEESESLVDDFERLFELEDIVKVNCIKPFEIKLKLNDNIVNFEIDTGSPISAISENYFKNSIFKKLTLNKTDRKFQSYLGDPIIPCGFFEVKVECNEMQRKLKLFVLPGKSLPILGRDWISSLNLEFKNGLGNVKKLDIAKIDDIELLLKEFEDTFSDKLGKYNVSKLKLHLKDNVEPVFCKPRPVPYALKVRLEDELDRLQRLEVLKLVEHADWATPIVPILKNNGEVRICGDYKITVNPCLKIDRHPIPRTQDLLATLSHGTVFSKLDLSFAYLQVELDESSRPLTTITTHKGLFEYNRLNFGISSAPGLFQREMEKLLSGIEGAVGFFDDFIVLGSTREEHDSRLKEVLRRIRDSGLKLGRDKCEFAKDNVKFLGYELGKKGISASQDKVKAILKIKEPTNVTELQSFIGIMNYYSKFIRNYASMMYPLYKLLKKDQKWNWDRESDRAFQSAKKSLMSSEVLMPYDTRLPVKITTDASPYGLGAVLVHVLEGNVERPVAFASRTLTKAESGYSQLDREALGVVEGVKSFHQFVYGRHFILETDHKPLIYIFGEKKGLPQMAASRVQRWGVFLSGYDYEIKFLKGKNNQSADFLSRYMGPSLVDLESGNKDDFTYLNFVTENVKLISAESISEETDKDDNLKRVKQFVLNGWPNKVPESLIPFSRKSNDLYIDKGCIMWGHRVVVPKLFREELVKELHSSHMGIVRMKSIARSYIWWPGLDNDIENMGKTCVACLENANNPPRVTLHPWNWPEGPNHRLHVDFLGPVEGDMYIVIIDAFSKWIEVKKMKNITAPETIRVLKEYFGVWGLPLKLVSDNGPTFTSQSFLEFIKMNGIIHVKTAPYHPSTNGAAENLVKTFKEKFILLMSENGKDKQDALVKFLFHYRSSPHCTTGVSPAELQLGRKLRTRWDLLKTEIRERVIKEQGKQKNYYGGNRKVEFNEQEVLMAKDYSGKKNKWCKVQVAKRLSPVSYLVRTCDGREWKRHVDQLRSCHLAFEKNSPCDIEMLDSHKNFVEDVVVKPIELSSVENKNIMITDTSVNDVRAEKEYVEQVEQKSVEPELRRSTRIRKQRTIFGVNA